MILSHRKQEKRFMSGGSPKRLAGDERKARILEATIRLLERKGLDGFSLDAVAREAGVALSLPRHYFGGYRDLLKAATEDLLRDVETILLSREVKTPLPERFAAYLDILRRNPWGHEVWMRSAQVHPGVDAIVRRARRRMAEGMYRKPWGKLSRREQFDARGRIGYVEALVGDWLGRNGDRDTVVELIMGAITLPQAVGL
jgi:AcrR family transcriptional regulator